jgi:hypothetical protein
MQTNILARGIFLRAVLLCQILACAAHAAILSVGSNINISKSSGENAEESIVINPLNPANLFASETYSLVTKYSLDGGLTWNNSNTSALGSSVGDVSASWDAYGNLFLVRLTSSPYHVVVGVSTNGGATFSFVYQTKSGDNDQPTIVTGPSSVAGQQSVWINYTDTSGNLIAQGAAVAGLGVVGSFGGAQIAPGFGGDFGDIAVGPVGQMMVVYQDADSGIGPDTIYVNLDPNGLGTGGFSAAISATTTRVGAFAPIPAQPKREIDAEAGLAWDCSGGLHNGRVYLVYTDRASTSTSDTDIYVRYSDDNGTNWSAAVRVNDDPVGDGKSQFLPRIALDQTTGNIAVSFYDCRNSPSNNKTELWATVSTNGGLTFQPNVKVSAGVSSALVSVVSATQFDYGDYIGLSFCGGVFYPCWADNSNSTGDNPNGALNYFDMYTARVTVNMPVVILDPRWSDTNFVCSVRTTVGKNYFLESSPGLENPTWTAAPAVPGDGSVKVLVDANHSSPQNFYRVREE